MTIKARVAKLERVHPDAGTIFVLRERGESKAKFRRRVKAARQGPARTVFSLNMGGNNKTY